MCRPLRWYRLRNNHEITRGIFALALFFFAACAGFGQTLLGAAAGDFYSAFAKMGIDEKRLTSLESLTPYIPAGVLERLREKENLVYRAGFIGFAANQLGVITGHTSSVGFAETLKALTGFLMVVEESGEIKEWTIKEIAGRYEQLLASSWRNVNSPLFTVMLEAYCSYRRGELWAGNSAGARAAIPAAMSPDISGEISTDTSTEISGAVQ